MQISVNQPSFRESVCLNFSCDWCLCYHTFIPILSFCLFMASEFSTSMKDVDFACFHSERCVSVIWRIREFSKIEKECECSPAFTFSDLEWTLKVYPNKNEHVSASLYPQSGNERELKCNFFIKDNRDKTVKESGVLTRSFKVGEGCGFRKFLERQDLLDGKVGKVLLNDTLTVHCEILDPEKVSEDPQKTSTNDAKAIAVLDDLEKLLNSGWHSDVLLKCGGDSYRAHKLILSCRSEVFRAMFDSDTKENASNSVDLIDMPPRVAKMMFRYMYADKLDELSEDNVMELYAAADKYCLLAMKSKCREFVLENLTVDNVCDVAILADLHSDDVLREAAEELFSLNLKAVVQTGRWTALKAKHSPLLMTLVENAILSNPFVLK